MFERRLKIMLGLVFMIAAVLLCRAVQLQVVEKEIWDTQASTLMKQVVLTATSRGPIVDRNGVILAYDDACIDAAVDYRAIVLDPDWLKERATARVPPRGTALPKGVTRKQLITEETEHVKADIDRMWITLGMVGNKSPEEIEEIKQSIQARVNLLQRKAWFVRFDKNGKAADAEQTESTWRKWLEGESADTDETKHEAAVDASHVDVGEQRQTHVVLANLNSDQIFELQKALPSCPGLELKPSAHRVYSPDAAKYAALLMGHLAPVLKVDQDADPNSHKDELREYMLRDLIGRDGLERLAEQCLRGSKGKEVHEPGKSTPQQLAAPIPGKEAKTTIDIELQKEIDQAFDHPILVHDNDGNEQRFSDLHGAAVVIDVKTGEILALVSHPTFDLNSYEADFHTLMRDEINKPLLNRATQQALPPGSTCKTIIGSVAVTRGVLSSTEGILCDGYLQIPDPRDPSKTKRFEHSYRCWTARLTTPALRHSAPEQHHSLYGYPDGYLSLADAIQRSCNVYFETVAFRMKMPMVIDALDSFGLGRPTGIGIAESGGTIPVLSRIKPKNLMDETFNAGIGEGLVTATPLQMANVVATLARGGIWVRPKLLKGEAADIAARYHSPSTRAFAEDVRDLHLDPDALAKIKDGMIKVCRSRSGTGPSDDDSPGIRQLFEDYDVAGKTGSAQITNTVYTVHLRDENGKLIHEDTPADVPYEKRPLKVQEIHIGEYPWIQGTGKDNAKLAHAWFMGYAPAHDPQIAFCVMVEFGGSGGRVAGPIGRELLEACARHHYIYKVPRITAQLPTELLHNQ